MGLIRKEANEKKWLAVMCQLDNPAVNLRNIGNRRKKIKKGAKSKDDCESDLLRR